MSKTPRNGGRRKKEDVGSKFEPEHNREGATVGIERADPICPLPRRPPLRHEDKRAVEIEVPKWKPFQPNLAPEGEPSRALAAFQLGHLGVSMWEQAEVLWNLLAARPDGLFWHPSAEDGVPRTASRLLAARRVLFDVIPENVLREMATLIDWFRESNEKWIEKADTGELNLARHIGKEAPWETEAKELRFHCDRAIPKSHLLRPLFDLGVAFGEFDLLVNAHYSTYFDYRWPEIGEIARRASAIPISILARSPLLSSLARIGSDYERIGHPDALHRYIQENRECWTRSNWFRRSKPKQPQPFTRVATDGENPPAADIRDDQVLKLDDLLAMRIIAIEQVYSVEEVLAKIPDTEWELGTVTPIAESPPSQIKPRWHDGTAEHSVGTTELHTRKGAAPDQTKILDRFEEGGWPMMLKASQQGGELLSKPSWDKESYELKLEGRTIRRVSPTKARNIIPILDAFQEEGWPTKIDDPLSGEPASQKARLKEAVKSLNKKLAAETIVFSVFGGESIRWAHA